MGSWLQSSLTELFGSSSTSSSGSSPSSAAATSTAGMRVSARAACMTGTAQSVSTYTRGPSGQQLRLRTFLHSVAAAITAGMRLSARALLHDRHSTGCQQLVLWTQQAAAAVQALLGLCSCRFYSRCQAQLPAWSAQYQALMQGCLQQERGLQ